MGSDDAKRSALMVVLVVVGVPVLIVVLLVVVLAGGGQPPPCGPGAGSSPGLGPLSANGIPAALVPVIAQAGTACPEFPAPIIAAELQQESGFNANAVSPSGAQGIAQFMPDTWPSYGVGSPFDPTAAIPAQAKYLCEMAGQIRAADANGLIHLTVSVTEAALFGYNAGLGAVLASGNGVPTNSQSADYVPRIMTMARTQFSAAGTTTGGGVHAAAAPVPPGAGTGCGPVTLTGVGSGGGGPAAQKIVAAAQSQLGVPYVWGGVSPGVGLDCSGLTQFAFAQAGITLPRVAQDQYAATSSTALPGGFTPAAYQPGDLLFWGTASNIHHVAIAIGNGQLIEAPDVGQNVSTRPIYESDFFGATRPLATALAATPPAATPGAPQ
jgi:cell wall-associated NlpC family hydrolase